MRTEYQKETPANQAHVNTWDNKGGHSSGGGRPAFPRKNQLTNYTTMQTIKLTSKDFKKGDRYYSEYVGKEIAINADVSVEIEGNLGWVKFDRLYVKGSIVAAAGTGIEAGGGIKAGEGIEAGWGIKAGEGIEAGWGIDKIVFNLVVLCISRSLILFSHNHYLTITLQP